MGKIKQIDWNRYLCSPDDWECWCFLNSGWSISSGTFLASWKGIKLNHQKCSFLLTMMVRVFLDKFHYTNQDQDKNQIILVLAVYHNAGTLLSRKLIFVMPIELQVAWLLVDMVWLILGLLVCHFIKSSNLWILIVHCNNVLAGCKAAADARCCDENLDMDEGTSQPKLKWQPSKSAHHNSVSQTPWTCFLRWHQTPKKFLDIDKVTRYNSDDSLPHLNWYIII